MLSKPVKKHLVVGQLLKYQSDARGRRWVRLPQCLQVILGVLMDE
jgi:hypothetical protein